MTIFHSEDGRPADPDVIVDAVCEWHRVSVGDLIGVSQTKRLTQPRRMAAIMLKEMCGFSLAEIGQHLSRHHTSVMHMIRHGVDPVQYAECEAYVRNEMKEDDANA